ncbi:Uncharacterized protein T09_13813 [Trichinella sp. T9]|nr:Uncharacterized protein T09_13813 [Trichinella sp. T9]
MHINNSVNARKHSLGYFSLMLNNLNVEVQRVNIRQTNNIIKIKPYAIHLRLHVCDDNTSVTVNNGAFSLDKHGPAVVRTIVASIGLSNQDSELLIHLAAVNLEESGINWLRHNLPNNYIKFELLCKNEIDNSAVCEVSVKYKTLPMMMKNVNREIVRRGLGQVIDYTDNEHIKALHMIPRYNRLVQNLLLSESYADKRGVGKWKRPKLVEAVSGYPSQIVDLVKNSNIFIFLQLCYNAGKEGAILLKNLSRHINTLALHIYTITGKTLNLISRFYRLFFKQ